MLTPMMGNAMPDRGPFGVDTGCFAAPEKFLVTDYVAWLHARRKHAHRCLFATAPDVWGDGVATWEQSRRVLPLIREMGYPAAVVAQPGIETVLDWDAFDVLFVGGPNDWQQSPTVAALVREARSRGTWCHRGRVNSERRLMASAAMGYDSADGTYAAFGPDINVPKLLRWLDQVSAQRTLWEVPA